MTNLYDISITISADMIVWPGDPSPILTSVYSLENNDPCTLTKLQMGVHTGTHIDAPAHFIRNGSFTESIPLDTLIGPCVVVETDVAKLICKKDLLQYDIASDSRILFKTANSGLRAGEIRTFTMNFVALSHDAAEYLVEKNIRLVGLDYLSIEPFASVNSPVHKLFLGHGVVILEGLNLFGVDPGNYELLCLPLKIAGCEAAPVRAVLRRLP